MRVLQLSLTVVVDEFRTLLGGQKGVVDKKKGRTKPPIRTFCDV